MRTLTLVCALAAATVAPAFAEDSAIRIRTAGLDLTNANAVAGLHVRIERAARKACGMTNRLSPRAYQQRAACVTAKVDEAVRTADLPPLTRLHAELRAAPRG